MCTNHQNKNWGNMEPEWTRMMLNNKKIKNIEDRGGLNGELIMEKCWKRRYFGKNIFDFYVYLLFFL